MKAQRLENGNLLVPVPGPDGDSHEVEEIGPDDARFAEWDRLVRHVPVLFRRPVFGLVPASLVSWRPSRR